MWVLHFAFSVSVVVSHWLKYQEVVEFCRVAERCRQHPVPKLAHNVFDPHLTLPKLSHPSEFYFLLRNTAALLRLPCLLTLTF